MKIGPLQSTLDEIAMKRKSGLYINSPAIDKTTSNNRFIIMQLINYLLQQIILMSDFSKTLLS